MSLELAAQHLASRGRKGDSMLVHMAPQEVAGLQALAKAAGGSLTLNPDTGLPEANFLKRMLPMIIGAALTPLTGGAINPMNAGMLVGGFETLRTGNLEKGLMAGLGAYGGAGLAGSLMGAGTGLTATGGVMGANPMVAQPMTFGADAIGAGIGANPMVAQPMTFGAEATGALADAPSLAKTLNLQAQQQAATMANPINAAQAVPTVTPSPSVPPLSEVGKNTSRLLTADNLKYGLAAAAPALLREQEQAAPYAGSGPNPYNFAFNYDRPEGPSYDSREAMQLRSNLRPITRMAEGGPIENMSYQNRMDTMRVNGGQMFAEGGEAKEDVSKGMSGASADAFRYLMGESAASPRTSSAQNFAVAPTIPSLYIPAAPPPLAPTPVKDPFDYPGHYSPTAKNGGLMSLARGGVSYLGDYSDGGRLLKGPGDGVSDSIPATIANKRPARLADGEFVVPARIVSELGNGSTEAGARKLYAMMDRVQKARGKTTGKNRVAVNSRAEKLLPA